MRLVASETAAPRLDGAQGEFILHAICHNLSKLANATHPATC